jgi:multidrug efflux pump subunit AcrB
MMNLSTLAVRERTLTLFFLILSVFAGVFAFISMGREEDPSFTVRVLMVSAVWPGATPDELQTQVVDRLEKRIQEVEYLYRIQTTVRAGRADLQVEFRDSTPNDKIPDLLYDVRKRMLDVQPSLPKGVIGPIVNDDFSDVYFNLIAVTAPKMPLHDLVTEAEKIRDRLRRLEGIHKVLVFGEYPQRMFVDFDMARLTNLGISPQTIFDTIEANNMLVPSGRIETAGPSLNIRVDSDLSDPKQLASVPIQVGTQTLKLSDVATIHKGYQDPPQFMIRSKGDDAVLLGVVVNKGINGLEVGERLGEFVKQEKSKLPLGMSITVLTNQAKAIKEAVNLFQVKFFVAIGVVMFISILALGLRAGLIVGIAVPLTLGISFLLLLLKGINLDRITLGALIISLGLLVDDAIISVEMMLVKMEEGWDRIRSASHAWVVTAAPMLFGTLVTISGFFPIGFARSGVGEYAGNIFWVLAISLTVSWLVSVTFVPYLGVKMLPDLAKSKQHANNPYQTRNYRILRSIIKVCVKYKKTVILITVGLFFLAVMGMVGPVEKQFFPSSNRPEIMISVNMPHGTGIMATDRTVRKLEKILSPRDDVDTLSVYVGQGAPRFFISATPEPPDPAFAKIITVAKDTESRDVIIADLKKRIENGEFSEARIRVYKLYLGPPVIWPVSFRLFGDDPIKLREIGSRIRDIMKDNPHTRGVHLEWDERVPVLHLAMDVDRLRLLGLSPLDVSRQLQFQLDGSPVTNIRRGTKSIEVMARGARTNNLNENSFSSIEIKSTNGKKIPLRQVGTLEVKFEDPVIKRYNREPFMAIFSEVEGAQANDVSVVIFKKLKELKLPAGYRIEQGGSIEQSAKANLSIQKLQPAMVAFMLIFIMLQMRSFRGTFIVVATAPLGIIGSVIALLLFHQPFGFVALLGLTGLAGILMRNTLILTQQTSDNFKAGMEGTEAIIEAAVHRARPVILTALAAVFAFIPLTHDVFWGPLAYVLIGGVAIGTVITLLFVPALYALLFKLDKEAYSE